MQVILQGSLKHFPLGEMLALVAQHAGAATLEIETKKSRTRLVLHAGRLIWAESTQGGDTREMLRDAAAAITGTFRVLEEAIVPDGATAFSIELQPILEELASIRAAAAIFEDDVTFVVSDDEQLEKVSLQPDELKLLIGMGRGKTFDQLAGKRDRSELSATIHRLESLGLVTPRSAARRADLEETQRPKPTHSFELSGSLTSTGSDGLAYVLIENEHIIGRIEGAAVTIADASVSSKHAKISRGPDGFYIEDLSSRNGTWVNGEKVTDRRLLVDNDVIRFGKVVMTFNVARELVRGRTTARGNPK